MKHHGSNAAPQASCIRTDAMDTDILLASDSVAASLRHRNKRTRRETEAQRPIAEADNCTDPSSSSHREETQHCREEGAWHAQIIIPYLIELCKTFARVFERQVCRYISDLNT